MSKDLRVFKALGEKTKHGILAALLDGEMCACEIPGRVGTTQSNCSMHLARLAGWGLVKSRRDGRRILYSIRDGRIPALIALVNGRRNE